MQRRTVRKPLVRPPHRAPGGSIAEARIVEPGQTVAVRDNEERRGSGRMAILVNDETVFCDCRQFWESIT
jgi:hypothetical protein